MAIKLQVVLAAWKNFNLNSTQQELDETASEITLKQDESELSRKKLVEQLKEFKKNCPEETRKLAALIRNFQNEVDYLSKRSKYAETAFLKNYQKFLDIIDPVPSLEYSVGLEKKVCLQEELELENKRMKETIKEYNEELKEVKNQDVTIKNLKEKLRKYEDQLDVTINMKMKELQKEYITAYAEKENLLMETHQHGIEKLKEYEEKCKTLQESLDQSQLELFEIKTKLEDIAEAKSGEIDILMNDLERANHQASSAQKELMELKKYYELNSAEAKEKADYNSDVRSIELSSLEAEISSKDKEISQLIIDIKTLQTSFGQFKQSSTSQINSLREELDKYKEIIANYETKLSTQKDYEEVKRELAIIKSVEFNNGNDSIQPNSSNENTSKPLEILLLEKNKSLQNENASLRLKYDDVNTKYQNLNKECANFKTITQEQQALISQLETDLSSIQSFSHSNPREKIFQAGLITEAVKNVSPTFSDQSLYLQTSSDQSLFDDSSSLATESLLSIVSAQRERFKQRNEELEVELAAKGGQLTLVQNELDSLRSDNLKLYEKIRFLQSYEGNTRSSLDILSESSYSNQYEKSLDPFGSFSQKEKQKRYLSLSPFEKITLSIGHLVLRNKGARTATFIYVSVLHCLVFLVLYRFAFAESYKRDFYSDCAKRFAEHMHDVHGET